MSAPWSWNTDILTFNDRCHHCRETVRVRQDQGIVKWVDGQNYHTYCLLDSLARSSAITPEPVVEPVRNYWGILTP